MSVHFSLFLETSSAFSIPIILKSALILPVHHWSGSSYELFCIRSSSCYIIPITDRNNLFISSFVLTSNSPSSFFFGTKICRSVSFLNIQFVLIRFKSYPRLSTLYNVIFDHHESNFDLNRFDRVK